MLCELEGGEVACEPCLSVQATEVRRLAGCGGGRMAARESQAKPAPQPENINQSTRRLRYGSLPASREDSLFLPCLPQGPSFSLLPATPHR